MKKTGFTLVELLVVVAIIAILAAVGVVIFTNIQKGARDAKRKADINAIASAYESKFDSVKGEYSVLTDANFQSGKMPAPPGGGSYNFVVGPNRDSNNEKGLYRVCAKLGDTADSCGVTSSSCYCRSSSQSAASVAVSACNNFKIGGVAQYSGASQVCYGHTFPAPEQPWVGTFPPPPNIWVKCGEIGDSINCVSGCPAGATRSKTGNMNYYTSGDNAANIVLPIYDGDTLTPKRKLQIEIFNNSCDNAPGWTTRVNLH